MRFPRFTAGLGFSLPPRATDFKSRILMPCISSACISAHLIPLLVIYVCSANAKFHVCSGGFVLLSNFSLPGGDPVIKEYILKVKSDYLTITFTLADRSLMAFVNAIEVFSAPRDLIFDLAWSKLDIGFKNWTLLD